MKAKRNRKSTWRRQKPIKGGRPRISGAVESAIDRRITLESLRHACSKSLVIKCALATAFNIKVDDIL